MFYPLLAIAGILSFVSARSPYFPLKMAAGFSWFGVFLYWVGADLVVDGSGVDVAVMLTLAFVGLIFLFWAISTRSQQRQVEEHYSSAGKLIDRIVKSTRSAKEPDNTSRTESSLEYRDRVRKALHRNERRR